MTDVIEELRALGDEIGPAGDDQREQMRQALLEEAIGPPSKSRLKRLLPSSRRGLAALAALVAIPAATVAVASSLHGDLNDNFGDYLGGESSGTEIGRPVEPSDNPPKWFNGEGYSDPLVIASSGDHHLFMARNPKGNVTFSLDDGVAITSGSSVDPFVRKFAGESLIPLFALPAGEGRLTYSGLVAPDVDQLEMTFTAGDSETLDVDGAGFIFDIDLGGGGAQDHGVLLVDRRPVDLIALDSEGNVLQTVPAACVFGMPATAPGSDPAGFGDAFDGCEEYYESGGGL